VSQLLARLAGWRGATVARTTHRQAKAAAALALASVIGSIGSLNEDRAITVARGCLPSRLGSQPINGPRQHLAKPRCLV
jgi:hypothetical protein